ncbi:PX domain containing protein [Tritrichomonas foetus]|uniref:PX domain containing protein n=1 Tax=Tritrichomonas foetus TaxID=1144522 RepID=A0A1J4JT30_9EUKA|nr:PX domain containing protein [Tritrichomonas foetus]|eukprot:OHT00429.1 PX domain containing protein [Tritrichomonas foetus]
MFLKIFSIIQFSEISNYILFLKNKRATPMNKIPIALLPINKGALLEKCRCKPAFYISIENSYLEKNEKVVFYDIEVGIQFGTDILLKKITRRYSQMDRFNRLIKKSIPRNTRIEKIPPKKWFGNRTPDFIRQRTKGLQTYFAGLADIPQIVSLECFQVFFDIDSLAEGNKKSATAEKTRRYLNIM